MKTYTIRANGKPICTTDAANPRFMQKQIVDEVECFAIRPHGNMEVITVTDNETNKVIFELTTVATSEWLDLVK
jgi:uncharacterized FlaG/YvyC family protein